MYEPFLITHYRASWTGIRDYDGPVNYPGVIIPEEVIASQTEEIAAILRRQDLYYDKNTIAQHFEKPVITTNVGGLKESIENSGIGIVVPEANANQLTISIQDFFINNRATEYQIKISEINKIYSWSNFSQKIMELYKSLDICKQ